MTDDAGGYSSAKLRRFVEGDVRENNDLYQHTAVVKPGSDASELLSFIDGIYDPDHAGLPADPHQTKAVETVRKTAATRHVGENVADLSSYAVGLTDQDVDLRESHQYARIMRSIYNEKAPYSAVIFGGMNKGKTSFAALWLELYQELCELKYDRADPLVLTNMRTLDAADHIVTHIDDLKRLAFGDDEYIESGGTLGTPPELDPDRPKWWHFDECSTHLDARTNSWEVSNLYLPLLKRFAKVNIDAVHLGHSGYDIHADLRRPAITTEFIFKTGLKNADVYESMFEDQGTDLKYHLDPIPDTTIDLDPDDYSPWSWGEK